MTRHWSVFVAECRACGQVYRRAARNTEDTGPTRTRCPCGTTNIALAVAPGDNLDQLHGDERQPARPDWLVETPTVDFRGVHG